MNSPVELSKEMTAYLAKRFGRGAVCLTLLDIMEDNEIERGLYTEAESLYMEYGDFAIKPGNGLN